MIYDKSEQLYYETIPQKYIATLNRIIFGVGLRTEVSNVTNRLFPSPRDPKDIAEFVDSSIIIENLENFVLEQEKIQRSILRLEKSNSFRKFVKRSKRS